MVLFDLRFETQIPFFSLLKTMASVIKTIFCGFLLLQSFASEARFVFTERHQLAYDLLFQLRLEEAEMELRKCANEDAQNGFNHYLASTITTVKLLGSQDITVYSKYVHSNLEEKYFSELKKLEKNSPYSLFIQSEIKLHWAMLRFIFKDDIGAALRIRQARILIVENQSRFPSFLLNNKTAGILNIILGNVPEAYQPVMDMVGMGGSIPLGLSQLKKVAQLDSPFRQECQMLRLVAEASVLNDREDSIALEINRFLNQEKNKDLIRLMLAGVLLSKHHATDAMLSLQGIKINPPFLQYPLLYKMWGDAYLFRCDFAKAEKNYLTFLQYYKGKHYLKDTYHKLFLGRCMQGDTAKAMHYLVQLKTKGYSVFESDKRAERFARQQHFFNAFLLKSRLYFDGGYYAESLQTLQEFKWDVRTPLIWRVEYAYRNGRIFHVLGKKNEAVNHYQQALKWNGRADISYFAPSAALQLALLHEEKKDFPTAKKYFKQAQQFKNHEYRNSISYKAKLGLKRMQ